MRPLAALLVASAVACSSGSSAGPDAAVGADAGVDLGVPVADLVESGCSTEVVLGLSLQVIEEMICEYPDALVALPEGEGITFAGAAVLPYMSASGRDDLLDAVASGSGDIVINSAFRTVVQQYLLREWFELGRCGIGAAATPGSSNHESGRALDVGNYTDWASILEMHGWEQTVLPSDPVHFDHLESPDIRGLDVEAFQRLWNRNRAADLIEEDGIYGPMTKARIEQSPSGGFAVGSMCASAATSVGGASPSVGRCAR